MGSDQDGGTTNEKAGRPSSTYNSMVNSSVHMVGLISYFHVMAIIIFLCYDSCCDSYYSGLMSTASSIF